jgi:allophanate hydrolase
VTPAQRVEAAYARIAEVARPEVWIALRPLEDALADAAAVDPALPLAGRTLAVKDNIDVGGMPTTAGCPAFAYTPVADAPAVARLRAAGAIVLGKTNLDQFATGLVGTRSPYGAVRDTRRPEYVAGGSSSGSAVAVALGIADLALGTDTAGSGRVPAAFGGIVGIKPTIGLVPTEGVVPACRSFDCVSVLAPDLGSAKAALAAMAGGAGREAKPSVVAVPRELPGLSPAGRRAFAAAAARLDAEIVEVDLGPFLAAGRLLYDGAFVAERYDAVGAFVAAHADACDPTVAGIVLAAGEVGAAALAADAARLEGLRRAAETELAGADALLVPTVASQPTIAEVGADPVGVNARLGTYTNFCNLLDLCAVAMPAGEADGGQFGVTVMARAGADRVAAGVARMLAGRELFVVGAHRSGHPLNHELLERGASLIGVRRTAPAYRLFRLDTDPPKPGLVRGGDASIEGELWTLPPDGLASLLAALPPPMALGPVALDDGTRPTGFLCEPAALEGAADITAYGSWPAALAAAAA